MDERNRVEEWGVAVVRAWLIGWFGRLGTPVGLGAFCIWNALRCIIYIQYTVTLKCTWVHFEPVMHRPNQEGTTPASQSGPQPAHPQSGPTKQPIVISSASRETRGARWATRSARWWLVGGARCALREVRVHAGGERLRQGGCLKRAEPCKHTGSGLTDR
jgi:hypothetical protein